METSYELHFLLLWLSLGLGAFLGAVYDVLKLSRLLTGAGKVVVFIEDILFCTFCGVCFSVVFYNASRGAMRLYAFLAAILTFTIFYCTVGRLTEKAARRSLYPALRGRPHPPPCYAQGLRQRKYEPH